MAYRAGMKVTVQDARYFALKVIGSGRIAVSYPTFHKDELRHRVFASVYIRHINEGHPHWQTVELTALNDQYISELDMEIRVRYLSAGESINFLET